MSSKEYVADRVRSALAEAKGNVSTARQLLAAECARDARLMRGLVGPFLPGIVAHAIGRPTSARTPKKSGNLKETALDTVVSRLGKAIGETQLPRGMTALTEPQSRPAAGARHQDAIRQLADSYKKQKKQSV